MRPTSERGPVASRQSQELLEDLCVALRDVGVGGRDTDAIDDVRAILAELDVRDVDPAPRLLTLSRETGWLMIDLLEQVVRGGHQRPQVRAADGVRVALRCPHCGAAEYPEDDSVLCACTGCLNRILSSFDTCEPLPTTVLYRTWNRTWWCEHADGDSLLVGLEWDDCTMSGPGMCRKCVEDALESRLGAGEGS